MYTQGTGREDTYKVRINLKNITPYSNEPRSLKLLIIHILFYIPLSWSLIYTFPDVPPPIILEYPVFNLSLTAPAALYNGPASIGAFLYNQSLLANFCTPSYAALTPVL